MRKRQPMIIVFAGPNGSGKSTIRELVKIDFAYINADEIKRSNHCTDMEAAVSAEKLREQYLENKRDFSFETVLSTDRNLKLLRKAKASGYFIKCFYILTSNPAINLSRVQMRESEGGHGVPEDKIFSRYEKALGLLPEVINTADIFHLYDNTTEPFRIFKKKFDEFYFWENDFWNKEKIEKITNISLG